MNYFSFAAICVHLCLQRNGPFDGICLAQRKRNIADERNGKRNIGNGRKLDIRRLDRKIDIKK